MPHTPINQDEINKAVCDLLYGKEHQFFVRYFEWGFPLYAAYLPDGYQNSSLSIELPTTVIEYLDDAGFVSGVEIYDEEIEAKRHPNHPQDCLLTICKHMNDIIHTFH